MTSTEGTAAADGPAVPLPESTPPPSSIDVGLLSPEWAGTVVASASDDRAVLLGMLRFEAALARAQADAGIAPPALAPIVDAIVADPGRIELAELARASAAGGNPVIPLVARLRTIVAESDAAAAVYLHRGATSQDVLDTALVLLAVRVAALIDAELGAAGESLAQLAAEHRDTVMVGRTLTQHATPTTFGVKAAGWLRGMRDARSRLRGARAGLELQLGGAVGNLAALRELLLVEGGVAEADADDTALGIVARMAAELGLAVPSSPWHVQRGQLTALGDALASVGDAFGSIVVDVSLLGRPEIAELSEAPIAGRGGSSAMPHKRNPVASVLVASAVRRLPGLAAELHRAAVAVDERPDGAWHAEWAVLRDAMRLAGAAALHGAALVRSLRVHPDAMRRNLELGGELVLSERVMLALAPKLGRAAVQAAVDRVLNEGVTLREALAELPGLAGPSGDDGADAAVSLDALLDPSGFVGAAGTLVDREIRAWRHDTCDDNEDTP